jgi:hypothetical protein
MKYIFGFVLNNKDKKSSMACPSINIFGCRKGDTRLVGIVERRVFFCNFIQGNFFSLVVYILSLSPRLVSDS